MTDREPETTAEPAGPQDRCRFHPDCCEPDDPYCPGCQQPASAVLVKGATRFPVCEEHRPAAEVAFAAIPAAGVAPGALVFLEET